MPSPFPGMDPFLEGEEWEDFHTTFNTVLRETLSPRLEPRYLVRIERRVYVEHSGEGRPQQRRADVAVLQADLHDVGGTARPESPAATIPMPEQRRETFLVIRERVTREVVTVIETLSPGNKRPGSVGRRDYLRKREELLQSETHLVELDLLRGGERTPVVGLPPTGDYYAIVSRSYDRPQADVYPWTLRRGLPSIPIPLKKGEPDVLADLQAVFNTVYERVRYDLSIDYTESLAPPLSEQDVDWVRKLLSENVE